MIEKLRSQERLSESLDLCWPLTLDFRDRPIITIWVRIRWKIVKCSSHINLFYNCHYHVEPHAHSAAN